MINFKRIHSIRHLLDNKTTESICLSLCVSHLDYCNSVLYGLPTVTLSKLQRVQNMCVRLVLRKTKFDSTTDCLKSLHWLPIKQQITYKILVLTYKSLHGEGPQTGTNNTLQASKRRIMLKQHELTSKTNNKT